MTPLEKFNSVYLKREDKNLTGSAKDRAIIEQLKNLQKQKNKTSEQISQMMEYRKYLEDIAEQIIYLEEL